MCTVSYFPTPTGFIFTSNRDEAPQRSINEIEKITLANQTLIFPKDTKGGTWICVSDSKKLACILNGAFTKHQHRPPYKKSRGLVLLDFMHHRSMAQFIEESDFGGIEPFTMIAIENGLLYEFRWNGYQPLLQVLNPKQYHLWASATLYSPTSKAKRREWFFEDFDAENIDFNDIARRHRIRKEDDLADSILMDRNGMVKTVSISQVQCNNMEIRLDFEDIVRNESQHAQLCL